VNLRPSIVTCEQSTDNELIAGANLYLGFEAGLTTSQWESCDWDTQKRGALTDRIDEHASCQTYGYRDPRPLVSR
jgi:hypothetical protein